MDRREAILSLTTVLGYTITPASIISLSGACSKPKPGLSWDPQFFQQEGAEIVERLGEVMLPRTDTPGSMDVGAHIFVDRFLQSVATESDQQKCRKGLDQWKSDYQQRSGKSLVDASTNDLQQELSYLFEIDEGQQDSIKQLIREDPPSDVEQAGKYDIYTFLMTYKRLLMLGYYASEQVGENVLSYLPVPGRYDGCIPAVDVGNAWAL